MEEIKLKPCPFCGCEMTMLEVPEYDWEETLCYLVGRPEHANGCMFSKMYPPKAYDGDMLVECWNRRAEHE